MESVQVRELEWRFRVHLAPVETAKALLLGIVQGLTEFLPVSSSGHLVIAQALLGVEPGAGIVFEVAVHLATLVAILLFYRRRVVDLTLGAVTAHPGSWRYIGKLFVATLPAVAAALIARDWIERQFESTAVAAVCLLVTGGIVWSTRYTLKREGSLEPTWLAAILIGCAQMVAILPGISRSGSTVALALALGLAPLAAAEFSFLLGVIAMAGAGVLLLPELTAVSGAELINTAFGCAAALVSGLIALKLFIWLLREQRFHLFAWYA
ncbi:MAG TPA: undecaprenyl-diphosphate phosphatase, partial [Gammaproteobacteria bacterium]